MTLSLILQKKYGASTKHFVCENLLVEKIEFEEKVSRPPYEREFEGICKLSQIVGWAVHKLHLERSPSTRPPSDWIRPCLPAKNLHIFERKEFAKNFGPKFQ